MRHEVPLQNPFQTFVSRPEALHQAANVLDDETISLVREVQTGLLEMIDKLIEITRVLPECINTPSELTLSDCDSLAAAVHEQETELTKKIVTTDLTPNIRKDVIRFPYRLERIGDMLESILNCFRLKIEDGVSFDPVAHEELDKLFAVLLRIMLNTRWALKTPDDAPSVQALSDTEILGTMLAEYRLAHWNRVETGACDFQASSMYLDILDSTDLSRRYFEKINRKLLALRSHPGSAETEHEKT